MFCPGCGFEQPGRGERFCLACGVRLPDDLGPSRAKRTQLFLGTPTQINDAREAVLRVSRYGDAALPQPDGSIRLVRRHARISIWEVDRPVAAVSLGEEEATRLAEFLRSDRERLEGDASARGA